MTERHTGKAIFEEYSKCLEEFEMTEKIVQSVTDAASNMRVAVASAGSEHHLCMGHALHNFVTVDGFRGDARLHELLVQCRALVRAVHYRAQQLEMIIDQVCKTSVLSMIRLGEALETDGADPIEVRQTEDHEYCMTSTLRRPPTVKGEVPTRWHSILAMFESLLQNRRALGKLASHFTDAMLVAAQWDEVQELADFLRGFRITVEILAKEKDVTASLLLVLRSEIKECLAASTEDSQMLRCMKERMRNKFEHRFLLNEHSVTAALLDPRFQKLTAVEDYLKRNKMTSVEFLTGQVERHVKSKDAQYQSAARCFQGLGSLSDEYKGRFLKTWGSETSGHHSVAIFYPLKRNKERFQ
ncbi:hypothetical protein HPB47_012844 [Ixodes persulcatus]|uniref:Uncharacterized protein n=1 Tax=Ixodes persulcatus TaxID=34615 RepID=A0AC60NSE0_IXOPE|nr:hypothetical protein HPB47_012844 [Ixodes persulcatus]